MIRKAPPVFLLVFLVVGASSSLVELEDYENEEALETKESLQREVGRLRNEVKRLQEQNDGLKSSTLEANRKLAYTDREMRNGSLLRPNDCSDLLVAGVKTSGVYLVYPFECSCAIPIYVYCDMETDGGGWTVIMHRERQDHVSQQVNFNQSWAGYKQGFGSVRGEHWLGNENIYYLTNSKAFTYRMDMHTTSGVDKVVKYDSFRIDSEYNRYKLALGTREAETDTRYDCYYYNRNRYFSTWDRDHDSTSRGNVASSRAGGWWYNAGHILYSATGPFVEYMNTSCYTSTYEKYEVTKLQIKIRPSLCDSTYKKISAAGDCAGGGGDCRSSLRHA